MDHPAHPSLLRESSPSTRLEKILRVEKRMPSTDLIALNRPSSQFADGNTELEKKTTKKNSMYGTMGGLDGPSWPRRSVDMVIDSHAFFGRFSLNRFTFYVRSSLL